MQAESNRARLDCRGAANTRGENKSEAPAEKGPFSMLKDLCLISPQSYEIIPTYANIFHTFIKVFLKYFTGRIIKSKKGRIVTVVQLYSSI